KEHERLGICFDTCHVFAAGYDLRTKAGYEATMTACDQALGLDRLQVVHLNDSRHPLGSHKDRHAHIGEGKLGAAAFGHLLNDPRLAQIPGILETPKGKDAVKDRENLATLRSLIKREAL
ncbi:MAG: deoxyribonuclease IV, partial [Chloroflexi bacterium]|nr:deoxyribonuclease IV [Chloroflexota bacterium]